MSESKDKKLVGAYIPSQLFTKLSLFAVTGDVSKSQVIRDSLMFWMETNNATIETMIVILKRKYQGGWLELKNEIDPNHHKEIRNAYLRHLKESTDELVSENIPIPIINQILDFPA